MPVQVWNASTGNLIGTLAAGGRTQYPLTVSADGNIAAAVVAGGVQLWDLRTLRPERRYSLPKMSGPQDSLIEMVSPDMTTVAAGMRRTLAHDIVFAGFGIGGIDQSSLLLWDLRERRLTHRIHGAWNSVFPSMFSADGSRLLCGGDDPWDRVIDPRSGSTVRLRKKAADGALFATMSADGNFCARGDWVWDTGTGRIVCQASEGPPGTYQALSPDGGILARIAQYPSVVYVWKLR